MSLVLIRLTWWLVMFVPEFQHSKSLTDYRALFLEEWSPLCYIGALVCNVCMIIWPWFSWCISLGFVYTWLVYILCSKAVLWLTCWHKIIFYIFYYLKANFFPSFFSCKFSLMENYLKNVFLQCFYVWLCLPSIQ